MNGMIIDLVLLLWLMGENASWPSFFWDHRRARSYEMTGFLKETILYSFSTSSTNNPAREAYHI